MLNLSKKQKFQEESYFFPYHYLDLAVDSYKYILHIEYLSYLKIVKELIKPFEGQLILDVGCGDGRFCYQMRNENVKVIGIDYSKQAIIFAKAFNQDGEFFLKDLMTLELSYKFDYIVLIETLEHFIPEQIPAILKNLSSVLKENGKLIITVPSKNMPLGHKHYQHFDIQLLQETLKPHFKIENYFGHNNVKSIRQNIFCVYRTIGYLVLPFRNKIDLVKKFYNYIQNYFAEYLEICDVIQADRLVAVCKKETSPR